VALTVAGRRSYAGSTGRVIERLGIDRYRKQAIAKAEAVREMRSGWSERPRSAYANRRDGRGLAARMLLVRSGRLRRPSGGVRCCDDWFSFP
jgi:hypothetical protein